MFLSSFSMITIIENDRRSLYPGNLENFRPVRVAPGTISLSGSSPGGVRAGLIEVAVKWPEVAFTPHVQVGARVAHSKY